MYSIGEEVFVKSSGKTKKQFSWDFLDYDAPVRIIKGVIIEEASVEYRQSFNFHYRVKAENGRLQYVSLESLTKIEVSDDVSDFM